MSYKLFLDDERNPYKVHWIELPLGPWEVVRNYTDFVAIITKRNLPTFIAFDHDLGEEIKTGHDAAKWLVEYCLDNNKKLPDYVVHSLNPIGKENISSLLENAKKHL